MDDFFFASYSRADAASVAPDLADRLLSDDPRFRLWVDVRDAVPGSDWDDQIGDAIRRSSGLLLLMSKDSMHQASVCKQEWAWALKHKKPVIPLRFDPSAELPFRLSSRQYIDFTRDFDRGLAQLRLFLQELRQPVGELRELRFRLLEAERELARASDEHQRARVQQDVTDLKRQITELERVAADPVAAAAATGARIAAGLEGMREPPRPEPALPAQAKFVNPPPVSAPAYFQDRQAETELLAGFLAEPGVRLVTVVGRGGIGKTALVCRLLKGMEIGQLPDGLGAGTVDGIVYLRTPGTHPVSFANLYADLCRLLPTEAANRLGQRYHDPHETPAELMTALLEEFAAEQTVVVLLDNFEDLLDQAGTITESTLDEGLRALISAPAHGVRVVLTTRVAPQSLALFQPGGQRRIDLDEGLPSPFAENLLRARDPDGRLGLQTADVTVLSVLRERTRGYPRALEAVAAILSADRNTSLSELLAQTEQLPDNVVEALVGEAFQRLDGLAQQVMEALAIFPVPVPVVAVDYLLQPFQPAVNAAPVLGRLVNMQFVRREAGLYYLHQVDRGYALGQVPPGEAGDRDSDQPLFTQYGLRHRAADYFTQTHTQREEWKTLDDLAPQLAEFELRCQGEDYDTAAQVLFHIDFEYLITWGHYRQVIELHTRLRDHLTDQSTRAASISNSGICFHRLGDIGQAIRLHLEALELNREIGNRHGEAASLGNLGNCHADMGDSQRAIQLYEQTLGIAREAGYLHAESAALGNLANRYADLGETDTAIQRHGQALEIARRTYDREQEGVQLGNLGNRYADLGQAQLAVDLYQQALDITREIGDRHAEALVMSNLASTWGGLGRWREAASAQRDALQIGDAIGDAQGQGTIRHDLIWTLLHVGDIAHAAEIAATAQDCRYPPSQAGIAVVRGIISLRLGNPATARQSFERAIGLADQWLTSSPQSYDSLHTKALALAGLTLTGPTDRTAEAIATIRSAQAITTAPGITARFLQKLGCLRPVDPTGALTEIRAAASG